ncbi:MAG: preprotein translocase subunit SecG [Acidobacteria bacterium]|nr:preprotein translocase subunit SecG [Acidobacteriota bacterium]
MVFLLYGLFFVSCVVLIATVLLQPGKTDAGALFTSNISSTAFQPRGSQTILSKMTIAAATTFMFSALLLAMPALTGNISVLETNAESSTETAPALDGNSNANVEANANVNLDTNTNTETGTNVVVNSNTAVVIPANSTDSANVSNKITESKPPESEQPSNK